MPADMINAFQRLPDAFWRAKPLSVSLQHGGEKLREMNHMLGCMNCAWCTEWDITFSPLAVWTTVSLAWHPPPSPRDHTGGCSLFSQGHRDSRIWGGTRAWCPGPRLLFYHKAVYRPFGSQFSYLNRTCIVDPCLLSHRE